MKVGDLVRLIGSLGDGPEVTSITGIIMAPWKIDEWWVVMIPNDGLVHWPESQMTVIRNKTDYLIHTRDV
jgi:hypothetical protein